jgi:hypothetical protein
MHLRSRHSTLEQYDSVKSDSKKEPLDHSGLAYGRVEQAASAQARRSHLKKEPGSECVLGYASSLT